MAAPTVLKRELFYQSVTKVKIIEMLNKSVSYAWLNLSIFFNKLIPHEKVFGWPQSRFLNQHP